jgi:hypothetical protein
VSGFWTLGILIIAGAFALLLFLNPNLSWTVKRLPRAVYPLFSRRKRPQDPKTEDYGFHLSKESSEADPQDKETSA